MEKNQINLGLIIDMTNTKRYYDSQAVVQKGVKYEKICCPGQVIPGKEVRTQFFTIVDEFLKENSENEKLIGVHCTHGLNRSGHLVCRYMIDRLGMTPEDVIEKFNSSRGHNMEREPYLNDLKTGKSHESEDYIEPDQKIENAFNSCQNGRNENRSVRQNNDYYSKHANHHHQTHYDDYSPNHSRRNGRRDRHYNTPYYQNSSNQGMYGDSCNNYHQENGYYRGGYRSNAEYRSQRSYGDSRSYNNYYQPRPRGWQRNQSNTYSDYGQYGHRHYKDGPNS